MQSSQSVSITSRQVSVPAAVVASIQAACAKNNVPVADVTALIERFHDWSVNGTKPSTIALMSDGSRTKSVGVKVTGKGRFQKASLLDTQSCNRSEKVTLVLVFCLVCS